MTNIVDREKILLNHLYINIFHQKFSEISLFLRLAQISGIINMSIFQTSYQQYLYLVRILYRNIYVGKIFTYINLGKHDEIYVLTIK